MITIPGQIYAKKNSQRIVKFGNRRAIIASAAYMRWEEQGLYHLKYEAKIEQWRGGYPVELRLFFFRKTKQKFDLSNMIEGVQDLLQKSGIIEDDSMRHVIPVFEYRLGIGYGWAVDKDNPRTEVRLVESIVARTKWMAGSGVNDGNYCKI